ncbi:AraC family transcriptional regulator [Photobacterium sp. BZF1]|uniref:AraC family transcriptional regulator n=1 Tax=Photobacterium sp. BZF1 TaxID=1904457 RepID=UPI001653EB6E|nr:AraC family transcriptional regulator [Photobacterium sp. BZF1]MBC7006574.1 AraC family transcriptional regulator [Photobacterium sp. BZF1]
MFSAHDLQAVKLEYGIRGKLGFINTEISGVHIFYAEEAVPLDPMLYPAGIAIIFQGRKRVLFGKERFFYDKDHFLIVSVSTPIMCETIAAPKSPLLGLFIDIDLQSLQEVVLEMGITSSENDTSILGVSPVKIDEKMGEAVTRMIKTLPNRVESRILGQGLKKEILYRAMKSEHGEALYALTKNNCPQFRINKVISYIKHNYQSQIAIEQLADLANMSNTSFHRNFKLLTGESPLQYIKKTKLSRARSLIVHNGTNVNAAAAQVGYNSLSQFSRDFKRFYNVAPNHAKGIGYSLIDTWSE